MGRDVKPTAEDGPPGPEGKDHPKAKIRGTDPVAVEPCTNSQYQSQRPRYKQVESVGSTLPTLRVPLN